MKILIAGDFVPRHRVAAQIESGDYSCLDEVKSIIQSSDYAIVNFESPVVTREAEPIEKTGPNLKCTERAMECIANAGFNCVTLANNHFRDYGQIGVEDTIDACAKYNIDHVGGGKTKEEAVRTIYKTIGDKSLAIINFCENEWSIASDRYGGASPLNPVRNYYQIQEAKKKADYVLVIVHGGVEGYQYPTPRMQETYRFFVDAGADAVVNHHQHCFSGYEIYKEKPIFYGLGNFCFDNRNSNELWQNGYIILLDFKDSVVSSTIFPYIQCTKENSNVSLLYNEAQTKILNNIYRINESITDTEKLNDSFNRYLISIGRSRLLNLEPIYNRFVRILQRKRMLPKLIKGQARLDLFDRLNCESHSEVLRKLLIREIETSDL